MSRRTVKPLPVAGCQLKAIFSFVPLFLCAFVPALLLCFPSIASSEWNPTNPDPLLEYHYTYDHVGNITKIEDSVKNSTSTFTYDEVNRLTSAIGPYGANGAEQTQSYSYDAVGNIVGTPNLSTDGNGNVTQIDGKTIYYDRENRPYKITDSSGTITEFGYDYSGQRVWKAVTVNGATEETLYCGNIYEVHISSTGTETQTIHIYAGAMRVASRMTDNVGSRTYYYLGDHLGSTRMMTDALRQTVQDITYEPWGNTVTESSTTYKADYKFTGQMLDDSTNLYYYGARYYDPSLKRFISPDTIVQSPYDPQSLNRYAYTRNNPLKYVDPSGHVTLGLYDPFDRLSNDVSPSDISAARTFIQAFVTAPFTMPYRIGWSLGELIDNNFLSPSGWTVRGETPPSIVSMKNAFNAGDPNPAINALGTLAGDIFASKLMLEALGQIKANSSQDTRIGYHATFAEYKDSILDKGFIPGTKPNRLGANGVYVNNTIEGAVKEFHYRAPDVNPVIFKVQYQPGVEAVASIAPANDAVMSLPLNVNSISAPSLRLPGTMNTNIFNIETIKILEVIK